MTPQLEPNNAMNLENIRSQTNELIKTICEFLKTQVLFTRMDDPIVVATFALFTWVYSRCRTVPYLWILGDPGTGKSTLLNALKVICQNPRYVDGADSLARFNDSPGTGFIDGEFDFISANETKENVVDMLSAGATSKSIDSNKEATLIMSSFCPKAITSGMSNKPKIGSPALVINMEIHTTQEFLFNSVPLFRNHFLRNADNALLPVIMDWKLSFEEQVPTDFIDDFMKFAWLISRPAYDAIEKNLIREIDKRNIKLLKFDRGYGPETIIMPK